MDQELHMARLEDNDDIEHYLTTFKRLAEVYKLPKEDWAFPSYPIVDWESTECFCFYGTYTDTGL